MKRSHAVLLTVAAGLGGLLALLSVIAGRSDTTLAAPGSAHASGELLGYMNLPPYQASITCTLSTTTTDKLEQAGTPNDDPGTAAPLSNYTGLALSTGPEGSNAPAKQDWFRLDNAKPGSTYEVQAIPDRTDNYNLGIVVYDAGLSEITRDTDPADDNFAEVELEATSYGPYYFEVFQLTPDCTGRTYHLDVSVTTPPDPWDAYEPNDSFGEAHDVPIGTSVTLDELNFHPYEGEPGPDEDWFRLYVKFDRWYEAETSNLYNVDTYMEIRDRSNSLVDSSEDDGGGFASKIKWQAAYDGYYYIRIINRVSSSGRDDTYDLTIEQLGPTATPTYGPTSTPRPGPTAIPGIDPYEPNYDFAHASTIGTGITYDANFIPWGGGAEDNDYYKLWIKPGLHFVCETLDLAPGVDTNMIVYDGNQNAIGGNDDVELGDYRSRFAYFSTYEGWLYILVGHGGRLPASELRNSSYKLRCEMEVPGQPTATSTPEPEDTPKPTPAGSPIATPVPPEGLTVRPLTTPTPVPATTPVPRFVPITLLVYYDGNDDRQPGAGEGIAGISAQAYEVATNQLLAQGFTDEQGNLEFTVSARGPVRVSVPFFGFSQLVAGEGASIYLRVPAQRLPGGAP